MASQPSDSHSDTPYLTINHLATLQEALYSVCAQCVDLGLQLGVTQPTIDRITLPQDENSVKLPKILAHRLCQLPKLTWHDIIKALQSNTLQQCALANEIGFQHIPTCSYKPQSPATLPSSSSSGTLSSTQPLANSTSLGAWNNPLQLNFNLHTLTGADPQYPPLPHVHVPYTTTPALPGSHEYHMHTALVATHLPSVHPVPLPPTSSHAHVPQMSNVCPALHPCFPIPAQPQYPYSSPPSHPLTYTPHISYPHPSSATAHIFQPQTQPASVSEPAPPWNFSIRLPSSYHVHAHETTPINKGEHQKVSLMGPFASSVDPSNTPVSSSPTLPDYQRASSSLISKQPNTSAYTPPQQFPTPTQLDSTGFHGLAPSGSPTGLASTYPHLLHQAWRRIDSDELQARATESFLTLASPTEAKGMKDESPISQLAAYVKKVYRKHKVDHNSKWPPRLCTEYINLALIDHKSVESKREYEEITHSMIRDGNVDVIKEKKIEILIEKVACNLPEDKHLVIMEGAPGVGKSTFAWEFCRRWERGEIAQEYKLVFLLRLREERIMKARTLYDLIYDPREDVRESVVKELKNTYGANTLFILEGFDELPTECRSEDSLFLELIKGKLLPDATILVTS